MRNVSSFEHGQQLQQRESRMTERHAKHSITSSLEAVDFLPSGRRQNCSANVKEQQMQKHHCTVTLGHCWQIKEKICCERSVFNLTYIPLTMYNT